MYIGAEYITSGIINTIVKIIAMENDINAIMEIDEKRLSNIYITPIFYLYYAHIGGESQ